MTQYERDDIIKATGHLDGAKSLVAMAMLQIMDAPDGRDAYKRLNGVYTAINDETLRLYMKLSPVSEGA